MFSTKELHSRTPTAFYSFNYICSVLGWCQYTTEDHRAELWVFLKIIQVKFIQYVSFPQYRGKTTQTKWMENSVGVFSTWVLTLAKQCVSRQAATHKLKLNINHFKCLSLMKVNTNNLTGLAILFAFLLTNSNTYCLMYNMIPQHYAVGYNS